MTIDEYRRTVEGMATKRSKYGNIKTELDGIVFDSKAEARRYAELKMYQQGGAIRNLQHQVKFQLTVNGHKCGYYIADFVYNDRNGDLKVEDVKGGKATQTQLYRLKKKLMFAIYGYEIIEIQ